MDKTRNGNLLKTFLTRMARVPKTMDTEGVLFLVQLIKVKINSLSFNVFFHCVVVNQTLILVLLCRVHCTNSVNAIHTKSENIFILTGW